MTSRGAVVTDRDDLIEMLDRIEKAVDDAERDGKEGTMVNPDRIYEVIDHERASGLAAKPVEGLDVERLARALKMQSPGITLDAKSWRNRARDLIAEYARLREGSPE